MPKKLVALTPKAYTRMAKAKIQLRKNRLSGMSGGVGGREMACAYQGGRVRKRTRNEGLLVASVVSSIILIILISSSLEGVLVVEFTRGLGTTLVSLVVELASQAD